MRAAARELDYDRYLAALLAPRAAREGLLALAAFHGEIARIPRTVREPGVGDIRLQWWRDALADAGRRGDRQPRRRRHARDACARTRLSTDMLVAMIDAYEHELEAGSLTTAAAVDAHAAATQGAAFHLAAQILRQCARRQPIRCCTPPVKHGDACSSCVRCRRWSARGAIRSATPMSPRCCRRCYGKPRVSWPRRANSPQPRPATMRPAILPLALVEPYLAALEGLGPHVAERAGGHFRAHPRLAIVEGERARAGLVPRDGG